MRAPVMSEGDTLAKALADVRQRMTDLQTEYDRVSAELTKLRIAEKSLASIVEGGPLEAVASGRGAVAPAFSGEARSAR